MFILKLTHYANIIKQRGVHPEKLIVPDAETCQSLIYTLVTWHDLKDAQRHLWDMFTGFLLAEQFQGSSSIDAKVFFYEHLRDFFNEIKEYQEKQSKLNELQVR